LFHYFTFNTTICLRHKLHYKSNQTQSECAETKTLLTDQTPQCK